LPFVSMSSRPNSHSCGIGRKPTSLGDAGFLIEKIISLFWSFT
jgi:hypothetical protein